MATEKSTEQKDSIRSIYLAKDMGPLWQRLDDLEKATNVSVSRQVGICLSACIDDLEKHMPTKRSFTLNGCTVTP